MKLVNAVYERVKELVKEKEITVYALSHQSKVPYSTIATMTQSSTVKLSTIHGICEGLNISLFDFFNSPLFNRNDLDMTK